MNLHSAYAFDIFSLNGADLKIRFTVPRETFFSEFVFDFEFEFLGFFYQKEVFESKTLIKSKKT